MRGQYHRALMKGLPHPCAMFQFVYNHAGQIVDSVYLEGNPLFEEIFSGQMIPFREVGASVLLREFGIDASSMYLQLNVAERVEYLNIRYGDRPYFYDVYLYLLDKDTYAWYLCPSTVTEDLEMNLIFNATQDAMFVAEYKNNDFYYTALNEAYIKMTGYKAENMIGKTPGELYGEKVSAAIIERLREAVLEQKNLHYEEIKTVRDHTYTFLTSVTPANIHGRQFIICTRKDISEYKMLTLHHNELLEQFQAMFENHVANILAVQPFTGEILDANPAACRFYGYTKEEFMRMSVYDINVLPEEETKKLRISAWERKQSYFLFPHRLKNGEIRQVEVYSSPVMEQKSPMLYSIIFDVTDRENYRKTLFQEKKLLNITLQSIGDGVVTTDVEGRILSLNKVAEEITGWKCADAVGRDFDEIFILKNEDSGEILESPVARVLEKGIIMGLANHTVLIDRNGNSIPISDSAAPIKNENGETYGVVMIFRDFRMEKQHQDQILYLSYHDALTNLYNRRFVENQLSQIELHSELTVSLIMADLNGLKLTNDVFGHETGDALLVSIASVLKKVAGPDDIVARWGGDEFLMIFPNKTQEYAEQIMAEIQKEVQGKTCSTVQLSVSMGCAERKSSRQPMSEVVQQAEELMYRQKLLEGKSYRNGLINTLQATLYEKSAETEEHALRLANYCSAIGTRMQLSDKSLNELSLLAMLHDIGKVGIHQSILKKPGPLTPAEWVDMKKHSEIGYRITHSVPELAFIAEYILLHHERWDGSGYPKGLREHEIPECCCILAVADAFDAMTNDRIYRRALPQEEAIEELVRNAGSQFDPKVVQIFLEVLNEKKQISS